MFLYNAGLNKMHFVSRNICYLAAVPVIMAATKIEVIGIGFTWL
jgi:hypothetical protein